MAQDTLVIFGDTFTNVAGIKATDSNSGTKTYIRPDGTIEITQNGTGIDVGGYAWADVAVSGGGGLTATITGNGNSTGCYVTLNSTTGTKYYTSGDTISFSAGDTLYCYCTYGNTNNLIINGTTVSSPSVINYAYTLPSANIDITLSASVGTSSISITAPYIPTLITKSITANGTYNASSDNADGYSQVSVNVSGAGIGTLLNTTSLGSFSTSSTTATDTGKDVVVTGINPYDALIVETTVDTVVNDRHLGTVACVWLTASSTVQTKSGTAIATAKFNMKASSTGTVTTRSSTTARGIYPYDCTITGNGTVTMNMYICYNSTQTGTINNSYTTRVYGLKLYDLIGG